MPSARRPLSHQGFLAGAILVALFAGAALLAPVLAPEDPQAVASGGERTLEGPTASHPLGTDALGRDVLSRVLWGGRVSLAVGVGVETLVVVLGCAIGLLAGYFGGPVDAALMRVTDVGGNMVAEAGLSFLGLGAQSPTISWGAMLADGQTFLATAPWVAVFPGAALLLAVLGVNLLGDGLRDLLDPRLRA